MAVSCNDYPLFWDKEASEEERRAQFEEKVRNYPDPKEFAPFTPREIAYSRGHELPLLHQLAPSDRPV